MAKADDDDTAQPSGRQKPLAEWVAELGAGPVGWGRAADELIAGRYRSWWFNHVTGEWNQIVQQYWLSPDPSDHRMAGLSVHERAWLRMNDATLGWEGRYAVYVEATPTSPGAAQREGTASAVFGGVETTASVSATMADAAGKPGEVQPPKNPGGRPDIDLDFLARQMERLLTEMQGMREEMGSIYAELNSMRAEMANMRDDMRSMRDEIRALSTTVLRMDGSVQSMAQELGAISGLLAEQSPSPS
jgi:hypothetical protein